MARDGAALLSQIGDLMQQYLDLPGATPLDAAFQDVMPQIQDAVGGGMPPGGPAPDAQQQAGDLGAEMPGVGPDQGAGPDLAGIGGVDQGAPPNFKSAREAALPALRHMMGKGGDQGSKAPPPKGKGTDQKKGKRTKASY